MQNSVIQCLFKKIGSIDPLYTTTNDIIDILFQRFSKTGKIKNNKILS